MPQPDFRGTSDSIASPDLQGAVNTAVSPELPLLAREGPGTSKTILAEAVTESVGIDLITWPVQSTTRAQDGLYPDDTLQLRYDSQFGEGDPADAAKYIRLGQLGEAFASPERVVLVIDEVDKADLEFPNDLLWELDRMSFHIPETGETVSATQRPVVIITSNAEKELPDAFLRRCVFHYIAFPDPVQMEQIVDEFPFMGVGLKKQAELDIARRHMAIRARRAAMQQEK